MKYLLLVLFVLSLLLPSFAEEWHYVVKWMGIKVARMKVKIEEGSPLVQMKANLRTVGIFNIIHRVNDTLESTWDRERKELIYFREEINERQYHYKEEAFFKEGKAYKGDTVISIPPCTPDPLALFYSLRSLNTEKKELEYTLYSHGEIRRLTLVIGEEKRLNIYGDYFDTIKIIPYLDFEKLEGSARKIKKLELWLVGEKRIPILMEAKSTFGRVTLLLENREEFLQGSNQNDYEK